MKEILVREAEEKDLPTLARLEQECFSLPHTEEQLRGELRDSYHTLLAAERNGEVLGYAGMSHILDEGYISNVAVFPQFRRQGAADAILTEMLAQCRELELAFLSLEVRSRNDPAIALYKKHGFEKVGLQKNAYSMPKDDAIIMTKYLNREEPV